MASVGNFLDAVRGQYVARAEETRRAVLSGAAKGMWALVNETDDALEEMTLRALKSRPLAKAWDKMIYYRDGADFPTGFVWSKAGHIINGHSMGEPIRAARGTYLVFPAHPVVGNLFRVKAGRYQGRQGVSHFRNAQMALGDRLVFAPGTLPSGGGMFGVYADRNVTLSDGLSLASLKTAKPRPAGSNRRSSLPLFQSTQRLEFLPLFWAVRQTRPKKRLDPAQVYARARNRLPVVLARAIVAERRRRMPD